MQTFSDSINRTFAVDAGETAIKRGTRVTFTETAGVVALATCSDTDLAVGVADEDWSSDTDAAAPSQGLAVRLFSAPHVFKAAGAIAAATQLGKATDGKVTAGSDMDYISHSGCANANELITAFKLQ